MALLLPHRLGLAPLSQAGICGPFQVRAEVRARGAPTTVKLHLQAQRGAHHVPSTLPVLMGPRSSGDFQGAHPGQGKQPLKVLAWYSGTH